MKKNHSLVIAFVAIISFVVGLVIFQSNQEKLDPTTLVYKSPREIKPFNLQSHTNKSFSNQDLKGKWSFLFLGYLSCPDICPMTMMKLSQILPELKSINSDAQVLFLSVDPKRDTTDKVAQYVDYFSPEIIGLRAEHKELYPLVRDLGLMYSIPSNEITDNYFVDHSAAIVLINPKGQIAGMFKPVVELGEVPTVDPNVVLKDFKIIDS